MMARTGNSLEQFSLFLGPPVSSNIMLVVSLRTKR
jgi:hypothetical protein